MSGPIKYNPAKAEARGRTSLPATRMLPCDLDLECYDHIRGKQELIALFTGEA